MRNLVLVLVLLVGACGILSDEDPPLEGVRIPVRETVTEAAPATTAPAVPLPNLEPVSAWTQVNSGPTHNGGHIAGPTTLERIWSVNAGSGEGRITSAPILVGGRVFVLDGAANLTSLSASSGAREWSVSLARPGESGGQGFGGGLATIDGSRIYATTGFGEVLAVDAASGDMLWRQSFGAPFRAGPAAADGTVIAVNRENQAVGLNAETGQPLWRMQGASAEAGLLSGASPALAGELAVVPFASGELAGVARRTGQRLWSAVLSGGRRGLARAAVADVTGDPVIVGPLAVAATQSGRLAAVDARTGQRIWTRSIGSTGPLWAAGETLFVMGDDARLRRLSARTGDTVWETPMPAFTNPQKREGVIVYSGPVLVQGRVLLVDSEGTLHAFDAETGVQVASESFGGGATVGPIVAEGVVYVLAQDGTLHAFR